MEANATSNSEIRIMMPEIVEEHTTKLYQASMIGSIQDDENNPLHVSALHGQLELDHDPELGAEVDALQQTPLHLASAIGDVEMVRALLEKNPSTCLARDFSGLIPLHHAVIRGHVEIVKELIHARPPSIWTKLKNGQTVLHLCVRDNHLEAMKALIEIFLHRDKHFLDTADDAGNTILDMSLKLRRIEMLEYLLSIPKVNSKKITLADMEVPNFTKVSRKPGIKLTRNVKKRRGDEPKKTRGQWRIWKKNNLKYKGDWLQEVQGTLMLVATVIATVTFQGAINPPGGVWQQDMLTGNSNGKQETETKEAQAGIAIMAYKSLETYTSFIVANSISFLASSSVILLVVSGFPLRNRVCGGLLTVAMCVAVSYLTIAYINGTAMVSGNQNTQGYLPALLPFWSGMIGMVILCRIIIPFCIWVVKKFILLKASTFR